MSVFQNPASRDPDQAARYVAAVLELIGDRDPIRVLSETAEVLEARIRDLGEATRSRPERPGAWSIAGVIRHLADTELVWAYRIRMTIAEDRPALRGYDQDRWAREFDYAHADCAAALADFRAVRTINLDLIRRTPPDAMSRASVHAERGEERLDHMLRLQAGHDLVHRRQVERIALKNAGG